MLNKKVTVSALAIAGIMLTGCASSKPAPPVPSDVQHMFASTAAPRVTSHR